MLHQPDSPGNTHPVLKSAHFQNHNTPRLRPPYSDHRANMAHQRSLQHDHPRLHHLQ